MLRRLRTFLLALLASALGMLLFLFWWWWLFYRPKVRKKTRPRPQPAPDEVVEQVLAMEGPEKERVDDLKRIEGIGPKISQVLREAGIRTYSDLAAASPAALKDILQEARIRLADPETWPEQGKLAAAGDWEALKALQGELKGGRRVQ